MIDSRKKGRYPQTMTQMGLFSLSVYSVSELTHYLRALFTEDALLQDIWVQGEVSNLSRPSSGHIYFTIKDSNCSLRCVMWRSAASRLTAVPRDGDQIEVHGNIDIYEAAGQYQLYVDLLRPVGEGILYQEFLRLKAKLEAEGLFSPERKRPIPSLPATIGVVTSPTGAALRDILNTLRRRFPLCKVILAPTAVQGSEAPGGIISAIEALNQVVVPDVILLARGGGSIEDLWAFNDEKVARSIATSSVPVITGIGHETDFTIADFVSDLRAPTPTAAAELATPNREELITSVYENSSQLTRSVHQLIDNFHFELDRQKNRLTLVSPQNRLLSDKQRMDEFIYRINILVNHQLDLRRSHLEGIQNRLEALNPEAVLKRGYSIVSKQDGGVVRSVAEVSTGDELSIRVTDGSFPAKTMDKLNQQNPEPS